MSAIWPRCSNLLLFGIRVSGHRGFRRWHRPSFYLSRIDGVKELLVTIGIVLGEIRDLCEHCRVATESSVRCLLRVWISRLSTFGLILLRRL